MERRFKMPTFARRGVKKYSKLGKKRKKKQVWRKPTGRDNKMREKRRGYPAVVSIGYSTDKEKREKINGKIQVEVNNLNDLSKVGKDSIIVLGKMGKKKKLEIAKVIKEKGLEVANLNVKKYLEENKTKEKKK
jgi:large subunit ribosomal protein L32e